MEMITIGRNNEDYTMVERWHLEKLVNGHNGSEELDDGNLVLKTIID